MCLECYRKQVIIMGNSATEAQLGTKLVLFVDFCCIFSIMYVFLTQFSHYTKYTTLINEFLYKSTFIILKQPVCRPSSAFWPMKIQKI